MTELEVQPDEVLEQLSRAARAIRAEEPAGLTAIVTQATATIPPAIWAGLIELENTRLVPRATLGEPPRVLDRLQQERGAGPCVDAARQQRVIVVDDMTTDDRWPEFSAVAVREGVCSMLCVPLWVDNLRLGTLSLYGERTAAFGESERRLAAVYGTLAALALADGQRVAQLTAALETRDLIGQAKGILIERLRITPDAAFDLLSTISQNSNQKLVSVAERLVNTGEVPG
ncbi:GAF and ANTAR domain-containing protein [Paractinoplanes abujensis]|uniref:GAF domain-containing protein n=1 Tax=Paractinoplanes abujensis TaxID=882441 RepID=A0A7W7CSQ3_9ACTN|nr:GAF and ANTAR domain-containing protein [Actinoplanes abujensis]MBB4692660.1 GAF domain-containing protein [Actinoplanes abujensis]